MKYILLVCEGLADEVLQDLGGRTPLEAAKTPVMDKLAQAGRTGQAEFVPANLEPRPEIAMLSILGYDPQKFYTGLAPLEAPVFGIEQDDREVIFRADLVTLLDEAMVDPAAGSISEREAGTLMDELAAKFSGGKFHFHQGRGYKNFLTVRDEQLLEDLDEMECVPPSYCLGQKTAKFLPKGRGSELLIALMKESGTFLDAAEINRVRIDLGENPANRLWLWGQGKKPRMPLFEKQHGLKGACHADADFVRGIAGFAGLEPMKNTGKLPADADFAVFYFGGVSESRAGLDIKSKIKRLEDFDVFIGKVLKKQTEPFRVAVTGDVSESLTQKKATRNPVPWLISGEGVKAENRASFNEKICAQSGAAGNGHEFLPVFLKN